VQDETVVSYVEVPGKSDTSVKRRKEVRAVPSGRRSLISTVSSMV
jgi:hypothetical protein